MLLLRHALVHHRNLKAQPHLSHACFSTIPCLAWIGDAGELEDGLQKVLQIDLGLAMHA